MLIYLHYLQIVMQYSAEEYFVINTDNIYDLNFLWNLQIIHITHTFWFFRRLKRAGSVLSRSGLNPFLYIWHHTVRTHSGLSPSGYYYNCELNQRPSSSPKVHSSESGSSVQIPIFLRLLQCPVLNFVFTPT